MPGRASSLENPYLGFGAEVVDVPKTQKHFQLHAPDEQARSGDTLAVEGEPDCGQRLPGVRAVSKAKPCHSLGTCCSQLFEPWFWHIWDR